MVHFSVWYTGIQKTVETKIRELATKYGTVYVMSGVALDANHDGQRDSDATYTRLGCPFSVEQPYNIQQYCITFVLH